MTDSLITCINDSIGHEFHGITEEKKHVPIRLQMIRVNFERSPTKAKQMHTVEMDKETLDLVGVGPRENVVDIYFDQHRQCSKVENVFGNADVKDFLQITHTQQLKFQPFGDDTCINSIRFYTDAPMNVMAIFSDTFLVGKCPDKGIFELKGQSNIL